jgi:hypothetical protein
MESSLREHAAAGDASAAGWLSFLSYRRPRLVGLSVHKAIEVELVVMHSENADKASDIGNLSNRAMWG